MKCKSSRITNSDTLLVPQPAPCVSVCVMWTRGQPQLHPHTALRNRDVTLYTEKPACVNSIPALITQEGESWWYPFSTLKQHKPFITHPTSLAKLCQHIVSIMNCAINIPYGQFSFCLKFNFELINKGDFYSQCQQSFNDFKETSKTNLMHGFTRTQFTCSSLWPGQRLQHWPGKL